MEDLKADVARHTKDLYHGDGRKPGLTTRMQQAEDCTKEHDARIKALENRFMTILFLLLTILGGVAANFIHR